ncbi:hypothetical protein [Wolbachia endosymbiont (group E) of Neria commutata]|uniref:hypothetical protein n=1 Tax=Wolbachia endosymbiont (group E) of Neria commutata TaxID=3066149 RepID=UPI0031330B62
MLSVARLGFVREIMRAHVGTYISAYQEILSSSYQKKFYSEETYKEAKGNIEEELLKNEVDNFIRFLVKKDVDFLYIINDPFRYFSIGILEEVDDEMPDFSCSINEIFDIFIAFRFDHAGNIRENIAFEQAAEITENIASKIEPSDEALGFGSQDPSTIVRYLDIISEKVKLPNEAMEFINVLKNNIFPSESGKFVIKDVVTANTLLDVVLSRDNHTKKLDCYKQLREIIAEILSFSCCQKGIRNFFIKLSRDSLIKLIHYKESFLKLLKSDKRFSLKQARNIILQLIDPSILDLTLSANNRNDSSQEIENFIIEGNAILSNSPANVYSQTEIDDFIKEAQAKNGIVCGALPDYVRCLKIYSIYYHSHPIFYHLLNRLIRINTLSLEQIRKFI